MDLGDSTCGSQNIVSTFLGVDGNNIVSIFFAVDGNNIKFPPFLELTETLPGCSVGGARWRPTRRPPTSKDVVLGIGRATQVSCQDQLTNNLN